MRDSYALWWPFYLQTPWRSLHSAETQHLLSASDARFASFCKHTYLAHAATGLARKNLAFTCTEISGLFNSVPFSKVVLKASPMSEGGVEPGTLVSSAY